MRALARSGRSGAESLRCPVPEVKGESCLRAPLTRGAGGMARPKPESPKPNSVSK